MRSLLNKVRTRMSSRPPVPPEVAAVMGKKKGSAVDASNELVEEYTMKALTWEMEVYQRKSAERTVPWFMTHMPKQYFREIDRDLQKDHLRALTALAEAGLASYEEQESQKLCELASKGDLTGIKWLVNRGAHPNGGDYDGRTPIHLAASEGRLEILQYLSSIKGFNINVVDRFGGTPLVDAIRGNHTETADWIRSKGGVEVSTPDDGGTLCEQVQREPDNKGMVELMLKSRNKRFVSFFLPTTRGSIGDFVRCFNQLPLESPIIRVKAFCTKDTVLALNIFEFASNPNDLEEDYVRAEDVDEVAAEVFEMAKVLEDGGYVEGVEWDPCFEEESLRQFLLGTTKTYLRNQTPDRVLRHYKAVNITRGSDYGTCTMRKCFNWEAEADDLLHSNQYWLTSVATNVHAYKEMERLAYYLGFNNSLAIDRYHMDVLKDPSGGAPKCVMRVLLDTPDGIPDEKLERIIKEVPRLKYLDDNVLKWAANNHDISLLDAEVASTLGNLVFTVINKEYPHMFSLDGIQKHLEDKENISTVIKIAQLWQAKFNPDDTICEDQYETRRLEIEGEIRNFEPVKQHLLKKLLQATDSSLRTNFYLPKRRSITIRVKPELMMFGDNPVVPYGVFFCHSRSLNGFQVRFRDIARGGLRIVPTLGFERFAQESMRHFDEVYGLAFAQQLKNKDIPEGGSKAVCMVNVSDRMPNSQDFLVRKAVRSFTDGLLDLITPDPEVKSRMVDYLGEEELLYLGPDENIIPEDIDWITERAAKRGMKYPAAFMSSKPEAGINHKVYGVTSEGVAIFLKVALKELGYDTENDSFTVKITGGPNGDVAGNMINILRRDYPGRANIVGMVDHSGGAENEDGLDIEELYRLFKNDLPLSEFDPSKIGSGQLYGVATNEEIQLRNTMHNRVKADAFVPAGGRPNTININNYEKYFLPDGSPSASLIVEAANIFTTPEARTEFAKRGISIVKDSSANKAGVSCSSYEIVSSMLLSKEEFMAVKTELVEDVLTKLRESARVEAELLFREYRNNPSFPMVHYSQEISGAINRATDAVVEALKKDYDLIDDETRLRLLTESLPKKLVEVAGDRLEELPKMYMISMMGAKLGSKMVYKEGLEYINSMSDESLIGLATKYVRYDDLLHEIISEVDGSQLKNGESIMKILKAAGVKSVISSGI